MPICISYHCTDYEILIILFILLVENENILGATRAI